MVLPQLPSAVLSVAQSRTKRQGAGNTMHVQMVDSAQQKEPCRGGKAARAHNFRKIMMLKGICAFIIFGSDLSRRRTVALF